jgi:hypothetical protein
VSIVNFANWQASVGQDFVQTADTSLGEPMEADHEKSHRIPGHLLLTCVIFAACHVSNPAYDPKVNTPYGDGSAMHGGGGRDAGGPIVTVDARIGDGSLRDSLAICAFTLCADECADTKTDSNHCGGCGISCSQRNGFSTCNDGD